MSTKTYTSVPGLTKALRKLPKEASARLRDASVAIAAQAASEAAQRALALGGVAALVAPSIRATRDRVPVVKMGSAQATPGGGQVADIIWGAEFGGGARKTTHQFLPHLGTVGYFLWPTIRDMGPDITETYSAALKTALDDIR